MTSESPTLAVDSRATALPDDGIAITDLVEAVELSAALLSDHANDLSGTVRRICATLNPTASSNLTCRVLFRCAVREGTPHRARFVTDVLTAQGHTGTARFLADHAVPAAAKPWQKRRLTALRQVSPGTGLPENARQNYSLIIGADGSVNFVDAHAADGSSPWLRALLERLDAQPVGIHHDVLTIHLPAGAETKEALRSVLTTIQLLPIVPVLVTESPIHAAHLVTDLASWHLEWMEPVVVAPLRTEGYGLITAGGGELLLAGKPDDLVIDTEADLATIAAAVGALSLYRSDALLSHRGSVVDSMRTELAQLFPLKSAGRGFARAVKFSEPVHSNPELKTRLTGHLGASGFFEEAVALLHGVPSSQRSKAHSARLLRANFGTGRFEDAAQPAKPSHRSASDERLRREAAAAAQLISARDDALSQNPEPIERIDGRVLSILHASAPEQSGGYAVRAHSILKAISAQGYEVIAATRPGFPEATNHLAPGATSALDHDGVRYVRIGSGRTRRDGEYSYMQESVDHYVELIRRERPSLVHLRSTYVSALPGLIAAKRFGLPVLYEVSGMWELVYEASNSALMEGRRARTVRLEDAVLSGADAVVTLTEAMKDIIGSRVSTTRPVELLPNAVDIDEFSAREKDETLLSDLGWDASVPVIGYVGSFVEYEGLHILIRALARLKDRNVEFRAVLVGDGAESDRLRALAEEVGLDESVLHFTGRMPHEAVTRLYSIIDVCAYPRLATPATRAVSPLKPFEAMAAKKTVIVSDVAALAEIAGHGERGLVIPAGDVDALAEALTAAVTDQGSFFGMTAAAAEWVKSDRSWRRIGEIVDTVLSGLLSGADHADAHRPQSEDSRST